MLHFNDLIDTLRIEYGNLERELHLNQIQRDEFQRKIQQQLPEMTNIQKRLINLENTHVRKKAECEREILKLRRMLADPEGASLEETSKMSNVIPSTIPQHNTPAMEVDDSDGDNDSDWIVGYNPNYTKSLTIQLCSDLGHNGVVCSVNFSPDGRYLATGSNGSAQIFDSENGEEVKRLNVSDSSTCYIRSVAFSPDSSLLATGSEEKSIKIWNIDQNEVVKNFLGHEMDIYSVKFSNNGNLLVSGSGDKTIKIWNVATGECLNTLSDPDKGPTDGVTSVCITPDSRHVISGSLDTLVCIWDVETGQLVRSLKGHQDSVYSISLSPDGKQICSGSLDKTVKIWSLNSGDDHIREFKGHRDFVLSVAFSPDGEYVVSGSKDKTVHFWDLKDGLAQMVLKGHQNSVISVAMTNGGTSGKLATGSGDSRARIWEWQRL
eukprot:TRINITY_DN1745_c0_g1_i1.p1 TRINITY_DN1745_c0_g1~~TRINITY_DN1745_c0_g1_i1.p1  ORF type:complete len:435 (+),score=111.54 TRINITY_DN1745_c0_g1_i1:19-1323(+)